ncbi:MAG: DNA polymerase I [Oligoflexia bacterium]|nr:DNA polymerase I [Oligoflexia bacterium]
MSKLIGNLMGNFTGKLMGKLMNKLVIIDLSSLIFRAFYAIPALNSPKGVPVNAVYGVLTMLLKVFSEQSPTHILIAKDSEKGSGHRKFLYPEYKANRSAPPENLFLQFPLIDDLLKKMQLPSFRTSGHEADDVIGSAVNFWKHSFDEIYIISNDKDLMQLVDEQVKVVDTKLDKVYGPAEVQEKMGVPPGKVVDYLAIVGDSSDNIPGIKGIGHRGAVTLLEAFGSLEECIRRQDEIKNKKNHTAIKEYAEDGLLSKKLLTLVSDIELKIELSKLEYHFVPNEDFIALLEEWNFRSLLKRLQLDKRPRTARETGTDTETETETEIGTDAAIIASGAKTITNATELRNLLEKIENCRHQQLAFHAEFLSENEKEGKRARKSEEKDIFTDGFSKIFVTLSSPDFSSEESAVSSPLENFSIALLDEQYKLRGLLNLLLDAIWGNPKLKVLGVNLKRSFCVLRVMGKRIESQYLDLAVAHYVIDVSSKHDLQQLAATYLPKKLADYQTPTEAIWLLEKYLSTKILELSLGEVFHDIDNPLVLTLANMEKEGVVIDSDHFHKLERDFSHELQDIEKKIQSAVGIEINLKSPKQVSALLFDKLGLPVIRKTKTINSTDSDVLETLALMGVSDVPALILRYRELDKLLSTYVTVLPTLVNPFSKRVHTSLNAMVTATGRLSSDHPNLQNIPVRSEDGKKIRKGIIADRGKMLLSADYSQIELRLLAHFSEDPLMLKAFALDQDIHAQTASEIFMVPLTTVSDEQRALAKAVNFGLMYGQSSFGLSQFLKISQWDAKKYITTYFERFHQVKSYIDHLKEKCAKCGYAETLFGRKRFLPDIHSKNRTVRSFAERMAINTPIQGSAADIIKLAMIKINAALNTGRAVNRPAINAKMLLQVHDELIFEVVDDIEQLDALKELVIREMEEVVSLRVRLKVELSVGANWLELQ